MRWLLSCWVVGICTLAQAQMNLQPVGAALPSVATWDANLLILDFRLDGYSLSDGLSAFQEADTVFLPLGEVTRLLSLAIKTQVANGLANGYIVREDRTFELNVPSGLVVIAGQSSRFDSASVKVMAEDIYVPLSLLSKWLPVDFVLNVSFLQLNAKPREKLPLQARLERERLNDGLRARGQRQQNEAYPKIQAKHGWLGYPFIDHTVGANARFGRQSDQYQASYSTFISADFLGMEGSAFINASRDRSAVDYRFILGRNDPDANLLGPMQARSFSLGNIVVPSVPNIMSTSQFGTGYSVSNRRLDQPTSFDRQSLRGYLPQGWDVTLYFNDALIGFQQSRADGLYSFDDLPLSFGRNDFRLVFNGPLGQMRTENRNFMLDQAILKPGEFVYGVTQHRSQLGDLRNVLATDVGLSSKIVGSLGWVQTPRMNSLTGLKDTQQFSSVALRGYTDAAILTSQWIQSETGRSLWELGAKTRLGAYAIDYLHTHIGSNFDSDFFPNVGDMVRKRDQLRLSGVLAPMGTLRLPIAVSAQREKMGPGLLSQGFSGRLSFMAARAFFTQGLNWRQIKMDGQAPVATANGTLQVSRRLLNMGLSAQMDYALTQSKGLQTLALALDRSLSDGYRVNGGLIRDQVNQISLISAGISKNLGSFAWAVSGSLSDKGEKAIALQLSMSMGRDPRTGKWFTDALPMANSGALAARAFVDRNLNGIWDPGEELVAGAGFLIDRGGRYPQLTNDKGEAFISRLRAGRYTEVGLDPALLEDPQWKIAGTGVSVLPRPGFVQSLDFPLIATSDVDGSAYLLTRAGRRGIGDVLIELVSVTGEVVRTVSSSSDGFYTLTQVIPGRYVLRVSPMQLRKLGLRSLRSHEVVVGLDSDFIHGLDFELEALSP